LESCAALLTPLPGGQLPHRPINNRPQVYNQVYNLPHKSPRTVKHPRTPLDYLLSLGIEVKMPNVKRLAVVALVRDIPEQRLVRGQVGIVMEVLEPGVFEVDFKDRDGRTYGFAVKSADLVGLHHSPVHAA
jgi:Domain of unknown function (DUF4926)